MECVEYLKLGMSVNSTQFPDNFKQANLVNRFCQDIGLIAIGAISTHGCIVIASIM